jgi:hypothetical protein
MGLRCLLGHEYANREVEREREERGDEVVVTYRTVETCDRCGERRIVSENKEVRPVQGPAGEAMATGLGNDGVTPDLGGDDAETEAEVGIDAGPDAGEPEPESESEPDPEPEPTVADADVDDGADHDDEGVDDAIILDDDGESEDRGHGEWPESGGPESESEPDPEPSAGGPSEPDAPDGATVVDGGDDWPDPDGEDEGFDARPSDADPPGASVGGATGGGGGERGGVTTDGTAASASPTDKQFVAADEVEPIGGDGDGAATEFFCPNCGYARAAGGSSMRAGDICPECHKGYIGER